MKLKAFTQVCKRNWPRTITRHAIIIMGEYNAKVGNKAESNVIRYFGLGRQKWSRLVDKQAYQLVDFFRATACPSQTHASHTWIVNCIYGHFLKANTDIRDTVFSLPKQDQEQIVVKVDKSRVRILSAVFQQLPHREKENYCNSQWKEVEKKKKKERAVPSWSVRTQRSKHHITENEKHA